MEDGNAFQPVVTEPFGCTSGFPEPPSPDVWKRRPDSACAQLQLNGNAVSPDGTGQRRKLGETNWETEESLFWETDDTGRKVDDRGRLLGGDSQHSEKGLPLDNAIIHVGDLSQTPDGIAPNKITAISAPEVAATENGSDHQREQWQNRKDFVFSCIGLSVSLHHLWRFPYLCYKHTGGTFMS